MRFSSLVVLFTISTVSLTAIGTAEARYRSRYSSNSAPTISGTPATSDTVGQLYSFTPIAADANGDPLSFNVTNKPNWADFNAATGKLSGTPGAAAIGTASNIVISVTDGRKNASLPAFSITVKAASSSSASSSSSLTSSQASSSSSSSSSSASASPTPTLSLSASPTSVLVGAVSAVTWSSTNATTCTASGSWSGTKATSGTFTSIALLAPATYTLVCSGAGGSISRTVNVNIAAASSLPTATSTAKLGPYTVSTYTAGIAGGAHYEVPKIWYPTNAPGPYPGVIFVPGLNSSYTEAPYTVSVNGKTVVEADITQWGNFLASHGFAVMFIDTTNYGAQPAERATALLEAVKALAAEDTRSGSPLNGNLDANNIALMGHSYGGAGAFYAANSNSDVRVKAAIGLSPVPNAGYYPKDQVPSLIIAGYGDPFYTDFQGQYNSIPATTSKLLAEFSRSAEFDSMHAVGLVPLGTHSTDPIVARLGLSFLELYLKADGNYQQFLLNDPSMLIFNYNP